MGNQPTAERPYEVSTQLEEMEKSLHGLRESVRMMAERIAPVLSAEPPVESGEKDRNEMQCDLGRRLQLMVSFADSVRREISELTKRVEL